MKKLVRDPLLHFLLLGAVIFIAHRLVSGRADGELQTIVVTEGQIAAMTIGFSRTWQRPPTPEELEGLVRDRVREEVYYREAMAMGLDRDDTIIRRRLQQKLEFVTEDVAALVEPTDAELTEYFKTHADDFRVEGRLTFSQVYLNPDKHGERLPEEAAQLLIQLRQKGREADLSSFGDPFLLERRLQGTPPGEVAKQFGEKFAANLDAIPVGQWLGPVESSYGVHLVLVEERTQGRLPGLAEVRDAVHRDWTNARRLESNEKFFQSLLQRYVVTVEKAAPAEAQKKLARTE
ncbi:MAG TPA: peptidylprolyl isomerase [Clostridia bacterium]|nr:peptidylprolyl isomerase [Clostridia bacterium]